jgi:hypothetical protein
MSDDTARYWQNWDDSSKRRSVEEFWHKDKDQRERRDQFNGILRDVAGRGEFGTVLDFSCGTCEDFPFMASLGLTYRGVDVTPGMLEMAREKFPVVQVSEDDIFGSKFKDEEHPLVVNSAVLPHLPLEGPEGEPGACIATAISELWRITGRCLVVRLFGVDLFQEDRTKVEKTFLYNRLVEQSWLDLFKANATPPPSRVENHRGKTPATRDIMVLVLWK